MFEEKGIEVGEVVEARKQKIADEDAWAILGAGRELIVGRGKKFQTFDPAVDDREAILKVCLGRTGNLRAPTLKMGERIVVGFNDEMYARFVN